MTADLEKAIRYVRTVARWHPTSIRRAPIGRYYIYEDRRIRLQVSDQVGLDDFGVWAPAPGVDWTAVLLWSPTWRRPGSRRCSSRGTGSRICARWRRAEAGSFWIGAPRTGTPAHYERLWRAENGGPGKRRELRSAVCRMNPIPCSIPCLPVGHPGGADSNRHPADRRGRQGARLLRHRRRPARHDGDQRVPESGADAAPLRQRREPGFPR